MDPEAALQRMISEARTVLSDEADVSDVNQMCEYASALAGWLKGGGFVPQSLPRAKRGKAIDLGPRAERIIVESEEGYDEEADDYSDDAKKDLLHQGREFARHMLETFTRLEYVGHEGAPTHDTVMQKLACDSEAASEVLSICEAGFHHGTAGYYRDGDYSSDADWVNGVGDDITKLEVRLEVDDDSVMDFYREAHAAGLKTMGWDLEEDR